MSRPYQRRSSEQKIADLEQKIATLKARKEAREKKADPVLKEARRLHKRLKAFIQAALDNRRPDVANSALGFKANLERLLDEAKGEPSLDDEEVGEDE
jgi:molecular chaperone GrpE (heat shock protein)